MTPTPFSAHMVARRPRHRAYHLKATGFSARIGLERGDHLRTEPLSPDSRYLRRWLNRQATLYNDLVRTVAAAPQPHTREAVA